MPLKKNGRLTRREALRALSACAAGGAAGLSGFLQGCRQDARNRLPEGDQPVDWRVGAGSAADPKFLIVLAATGGASIVDSFLAVRESESSDAVNVNAYPDGEVVDVVGSPIRGVDRSGTLIGVNFNSQISSFISKHHDDIMVATLNNTSVNHVIAQKRSITGNNAWNGRTIQEVVANEYGAGFPLPNVNMAFGGFVESGIDDSIAPYAFAEAVANPALWPLGLDGARGIKNLPPRELIQAARDLRNNQLDPESVFAKTFQGSEKLQRWQQQRNQVQPLLEGLDLITLLNIFPNSPPQIPLTEYGLEQSPDGPALLATFPNFISDPLEAQAAIAYLLIKNRVSVAVTLSPSFDLVLGQTPSFNPPLAFDFSHQAHRDAQAIMWDRMLSVADRLIDLLKGVEYAAGESFWDRTMIYFATDFGRGKRREAGSTTFGSPHDLNNGILAVSPRVNGNTILGGVNSTTVETYGFDPVTGAPQTGRKMLEYEIFAGLVQALGVDTSGSGLPDVPAMR